MKFKLRVIRMRVILLIALYCCNVFFAHDRAFARYLDKPNSNSSSTLRILLNNTDITKKTHTVWAGRRLDLTVYSTTGKSVSNVNWTINGDNPAGIWSTSGYGEYSKAIFDQNFVRDEPTVRFAFFGAGGPYMVSVQATVEGVSKSTYVKFNVSKPSVTINCEYGELWASHLGLSNLRNAPAGNAVALGDYTNPGQDTNVLPHEVGIYINAVFNNGLYGGKVQWVQLVNVATSRDNSVESGLDNWYPYKGNQTWVSDSPGQYAISMSPFDYTFGATMYLMWQASSSLTGLHFWVPIKKARWGFWANARNNLIGHWGMHDHTMTPISILNADIPPEWDHVVLNQ